MGTAENVMLCENEYRIRLPDGLQTLFPAHFANFNVEFPPSGIVSGVAFRDEIL
jgi:hypothetical protein